MEQPGARIHIGCGDNAMPGWINIDLKARKGVVALDVRNGLPFRGAALIYAEHFLEHLPFRDGLALLADCRKTLASDGVLRLSTPNLDWVLATHYAPHHWVEPDSRLEDCLRLNRAFHGWGHQFLYNRETLHAALRNAGFETIVDKRYGQSEIPELSGVEKHETWEDSPDLPHVLVVEASGRAAPKNIRRDLLESFFQGIEAR